MNEVKITYETLFDLSRREKTREELQELDKTFYNDVISYLQAKQSILDNDSTQSEIFGASESEKVKLQVQNIKKIVKELYERRTAKVIKLAMNRSKAGAGISNTIAMLPEEKKFFDELLDLFSNNRDEILNNILYFEKLGGGLPEKKIFQEKKVIVKNVVKETVEEPAKETIKEESKSEIKENKSVDVNEQKTVSKSEESQKEPAPDDDYDVKVSVRFKDKVPKFVGKQREIYGPYNEGDNALLPKIIANILINKDKAEKI